MQKTWAQSLDWEGEVATHFRQVFLPEESHDRGVWWATVLCVCAWLTYTDTHTQRCFTFIRWNFIQQFKMKWRILSHKHMNVLQMHIAKEKKSVWKFYIYISFLSICARMCIRVCVCVRAPAIIWHSGKGKTIETISRSVAWRGVISGGRGRMNLWYTENENIEKVKFFSIIL